jgi:hypothetical protein
MSVPRGVFVFSTFRFIFHALQGRRGGRTSRKADAVTPVKEREAKRIAASSQPDAVQRRSLSFQSNTQRRASLEAARLYKDEHGLNDRHVRVIERVEVTFAPRRTVIREAPVLRSVAHILSDEHQNWLRSYVRKHAVTRDQRLFIPDFIQALQENCNIRLSRKQMTIVLDYMQIGNVRLQPGYYASARQDPWTLKRRALLLPMLHYLYNHSKVMVWVYDQSFAYPSDHNRMGFVDLSVPGSDRVSFLKDGRRGFGGKRLNLSAF